MQKKLVATPAIAGLIALPIAGYTALYLLDQQSFNRGGGNPVTEVAAGKSETDAPLVSGEPAKTEAEARRGLDETSNALAVPAAPKPQSARWPRRAGIHSRISQHPVANSSRFTTTAAARRCSSPSTAELSIPIAMNCTIGFLPIIRMIDGRICQTILNFGARCEPTTR